MRKETQVKEGQRGPQRINLRRNMPRNILIKLKKIKDKENILKATMEKQLRTNKGISVRLSSGFSAKKICRPEENGTI